MKKTILLCTFALTMALVSCHKQEIAKPQTVEPYVAPCFDINMIKGKVWKPIFNGCDSIRIGNDNKFYRSGSLVGTWSFDNCSKFSISNASIPANNYSFTIYKLKSDSLEVTTATFGCKNFYQ